MMSTIPISTDVARRFCGTCGHEVRPQASFCGTCGQTMTQRRPAQPPAGPAQPLAGAAGQAESRPWLIPAVAALVLAAIAVPVMFVAHPFGGHGPGTGTHAVGHGQRRTGASRVAVVRRASVTADRRAHGDRSSRRPRAWPRCWRRASPIAPRSTTPTTTCRVAART